MDKETAVKGWLAELGVTLSQLIPLLRVPESGTAVLYLSSFDGFGNKLSDVDAYVVWPAEAEDGSPRPAESVTVEAGQAEFDVEYWPEANLREALESASGDLPSLQTDIFTLKGFYQLKVLHRVSTGACIAGRDYWTLLKSNIRAESFGRLLADLFHLLYQDIFDDAAKLYDSGDYSSAILVAQNALRAAAGVALARRGKPVFKEKWLYHGLLQVYGPDHAVPARFWSLLTQIDSFDLAGHAGEMLDFGNLLVAEVYG